MKKKLISGIALAAAVAVAGAALCACGDKPTGEEVTKEEFLASTAAENFTNIQATFYNASYEDGVLRYEETTTITVADGSYIMETSARQLANEPSEDVPAEYETGHAGYSVISDGTTTTYYTYEYEGDTAPETTWAECPVADFYAPKTPAQLVERYIPDVTEEMWDKLTFDSKTGRYTGSDEEEGSTYTATFEFNDKKITYYLMSQTESGTEEDVAYTEKYEMTGTYTYGGQTVTAPVAAE